MILTFLLFLLPKNAILKNKKCKKSSLAPYIIYLYVRKSNDFFMIF